MQNSNSSDLKIGLALSGGGSRAIAFHLGCLRALHDRGILNKITAMSTVSGGSVIGALYAYSDMSFEDFECEITKLLTKGLTGGLIWKMLCSKHFFKIIYCMICSGIYARICDIWNVLIFGTRFLLSDKFRKFFNKLILKPKIRFSSRTKAFEQYLEDTFFRGKYLTCPTRNNLVVNINAVELRTQTVFNFGSAKSGAWRYGELKNPILVSYAVAASAAYPVFLPAIDEELELKSTDKERMIITDGGIYDNVGTDYFLKRLNKKSGKGVNFIIACVADQGLPKGKSYPYTWFTRMISSVETTHRRTVTKTFNLLHILNEHGVIKGFVMPYLGLQDKKLKKIPLNLVKKPEVDDYPTNFKAMPKIDIDNISKRGEQLTKNLIETYHPYL